SGGPAAQHRVYLALLPSGPDAVRSLNLHRFRTAVRGTHLNRGASPPRTPLHALSRAPSPARSGRVCSHRCARAAGTNSVPAGTGAIKRGPLLADAGNSRRLHDRGVVADTAAGTTIEKLLGPGVA